ncbi:MAG TPA: hypothetical protein VNQ99_17320 [Xanthobacteraceae bacterium]|nr:hypothetical protein [Xanthobacteraceae bacterium]
MLTALWLAFIIAPFSAALSLDVDAFATFMILFCVMAGLCVSARDEPEDALTDGHVEDIRYTQDTGIEVSAKR